MKRKGRLFRSVTNMLFLISIGFSAYLGFTPLFTFFTEGVAQEFLAAIFATIFTVTLTTFLLNKQTESSEVLDLNSKVFTEKFKIYQDFLQLLEQICEDTILQEKEFRKLVFMFSQMFTVTSLKSIRQIAIKLVKIFEEDEQNFSLKLTSQLIDIVEILRTELNDQEGFQNYSNAEKRQILEDIEEQLKTLLGEQDPPKEDVTALSSKKDTKVVPIDYYVNLSIRDRSEQEMLKHGFWQAGGSLKTVKGILKIKAGDRLYAYASGHGYMAIGQALGSAKLLTQFKVNGQPIQSLASDKKFKTRLLAEDINDPDIGEYAIPVKWDKKVKSLKDAVRPQGVFVSPMTSCRLNDSFTKSQIERLIPKAN